jgi:peroxiredoxin Q/BCP
MYEDLVAADTQVIGVSVDDDASHKKFAAKHRVPFPLVTDRDMALARSYGAVGGLSKLRGVTRRVTYVIGKDGTIAGVFDSAIFAKQHLNGVKETIARLRT